VVVAQEEGIVVSVVARARPPVPETAKTLLQETKKRTIKRIETHQWVTNNTRKKKQTKTIKYLNVDEVNQE
jgi:hypothetical protein